MSSDDDASHHQASLTIGEVAERTGISVATLRAWEARHGFPQPVRLASGHRRYRKVDVDKIEQLRRDRRTGLSLEAAVERARRPESRMEASIFAGLRRRHPDLGIHILTKRAMLAVTRAIEDECCASAERPVLVAGFQRERFYRQSERRWRELARTASLTVALADFPVSRAPQAAPLEVALPPTAPLRREWAIVCHAAGAPAVLAGWERPGQEDVADHRRRFEALWTTQAGVVAEAARIAVELARRHAPGLVTWTTGDLAPVVDDPAIGLRGATSLTNRVVAYLDDR